MTLAADALAMAAEAGLRHVRDDGDGYRRIRRGKGFSYTDVRGSKLDAAELERLKSLVIPPAWEDVWICPDPGGHIQATGYDAAGRKQYIYHPAWEEIRDEVKFERLSDFGSRLAELRKSIDIDLRAPGLERRKAVALAVAVLDRTLIRVGSPRYVDQNETYGLTTLTCDHVELNGSHVHLAFEAKGGAEKKVAFRDRRLARLIARCQELAGQTLFSYEGEEGGAPIRSDDVNRYLASAMGGPFTAKDFRTWGATSVVTRELATHDGEPSEAHVIEAIDVAAEQLGNTRAVCRSSYVHPAIPQSHLEGMLPDAWRRSRNGKWLDRAESTVNRILRD